jgi:hypothetical protein
MLTVETEENGDSKSTNEFCLGPVQNIVFLSAQYFDSFVPIAQQAGQAAVLGRLSISMCLC